MATQTKDTNRKAIWSAVSECTSRTLSGSDLRVHWNCQWDRCW